MAKKLLSLSNGVLLAVALLLASLSVTAMGTKDYLAEKSARDSQTLVQTSLTDADFTFNSMRAVDSGWSATDGDPQLIYTADMMFTGVEFYMEYSIYPGEMLLYYTTAAQPQYNGANMAVISPVKDRAGWYTVSVPATQVTSVRIDPTITAGNHLVFGDFVVNPQKTLADYLTPDGYTVLSLAVYTLVLFAIFSFVKDFFTKKGK